MPAANHTGRHFRVITLVTTLLIAALSATTRADDDPPDPITRLGERSADQRWRDARHEWASPAQLRRDRRQQRHSLDPLAIDPAAPDVEAGVISAPKAVEAPAEPRTVHIPGPANYPAPPRTSSRIAPPAFETPIAPESPLVSTDKTAPGAPDLPGARSIQFGSANSLSKRTPEPEPEPLIPEPAPIKLPRLAPPSPLPAIEPSSAPSAPATAAVLPWEPPAIVSFESTPGPESTPAARLTVPQLAPRSTVGEPKRSPVSARPTGLAATTPNDDGAQSPVVTPGPSRPLSQADRMLTQIPATPVNPYPPQAPARIAPPPLTSPDRRSREVPRVEDLPPPTPDAPPEVRHSPVLDSLPQLKPITEIQPFKFCSTDGGGVKMCPPNMAGGSDRCPDQQPLPAVGSVERNYQYFDYCWDAPNLYHTPLYFEDFALERYGHSYCPPIQSVWSVTKFGVDFMGLPYLMALSPIHKREYPLGYYRPGDPAPYKCYQIPFNAAAAAKAAYFYTGMSFITP